MNVINGMQTVKQWNNKSGTCYHSPYQRKIYGEIVEKSQWYVKLLTFYFILVIHLLFKQLVFAVDWEFQ